MAYFFVMTLRRHAFNADGIFGMLFDGNGQQIAVTLEHSFNGRPKLPADTYRCQRGVHSLHTHPVPFETFEVVDVPNHTGILFHIGNYNEDSNGCILLGREIMKSDMGAMVTHSRETFTQFMRDLEGVESFTLSVEDGMQA